MSDARKLRLLVGSYTVSLPHVAARGDGIGFVDLDPETGVFERVDSHFGLANPSYLALSLDGTLLYAVEEMAAADGAAVVALAVDVGSARLRQLARAPAHGDWPCHIALDHGGKRLFLSNYLSGSFVTWPLDGQGLPSGQARVIQRQGTGPNPDRQERSHVHFALPMPDDRHVMICDAGTDEIARHRLTGLSDVEPEPDLVLTAPAGTLPRHLALAHDGKRLFCVSELGNIVSTWALTDAGPQLLGHVPTLAEGAAVASAASAIRCHPNGRFLYVGNRGDDSIAVFDISDPNGLPCLIETCPSGGRTPREFAIDPRGRVMVVANQDSHNLAALAIDPNTGLLSSLGAGFATGSPVCVLFTEGNA